MIKYFLTGPDGFKQIGAPAAGCWVSMVAPSEDELLRVSEQHSLDMDILKASLDLDERSRIDSDEGYTMVLVNIPTVEEQTNIELYSTIPLSIIIAGDSIITVCSEDSPIIRSFEQGKVKDFHTYMKSRFILQILYRTATLYLQYLRNIERKTDEVEDKLHKSTQNSELIELLKLEKSLVYFTTALRSNEVVLEKLLRTVLIKKYPEDSELLEDVIVENKQAIEMASIYSGILSETRDAFSSVISNNQNTVMKVLAVVTIVMSIPTMIFSAYGMNVTITSMPFAQHPHAFIIIIAISILISVFIALFFSKKNMFK
ncbi:MAG: magnesium transporter CorA family protein [Clostridiales bacterium]|nr:magnesium transporter CorA family protein [Clostridiales bacterium]